MKKIKQQLLTEKQQIEASEQARKQRMAKKFGKKVQQDVLDKRAAAKKQTLEQVTRHRKGLKTRVSAGDDDGFDVSASAEVADATNKGGAKDGKDAAARPRAPMNHKRLGKDKKYGTGGHRNKRSNDQESYADTRQFSMSRNRRPFNGKGGGVAGKKTGKGRPGKGARQKQRSRK